MIHVLGTFITVSTFVIFSKQYRKFQKRESNKICTKTSGILVMQGVYSKTIN